MDEQTQAEPKKHRSLLWLIIVLIVALAAVSAIAVIALNSNQADATGSGSGKTKGGSEGNVKPVFGKTMSWTGWWGAYKRTTPRKQREIRAAFKHDTGRDISVVPKLVKGEKKFGLDYYRAVLVVNSSVSDATARSIASIGGADASRYPIIRCEAIRNTRMKGKDIYRFTDTDHQSRLALVVPKKGWKMDHGFVKAGALCMCGNNWSIVTKPPQVAQSTPVPSHTPTSHPTPTPTPTKTPASKDSSKTPKEPKPDASQSGWSSPAPADNGGQSGGTNGGDSGAGATNTTTTPSDAPSASPATTGDTGDNGGNTGGDW